MENIKYTDAIKGVFCLLGEKERKWNIQQTTKQN
jgi:hypothetical protein